MFDQLAALFGLPPLSPLTIAILALAAIGILACIAAEIAYRRRREEARRLMAEADREVMAAIIREHGLHNLDQPRTRP